MPRSSTSAAASAPTCAASASSPTTSMASRSSPSGSPRPAPSCPTSCVGVGEALPYPDDHFDLVFSNEVIEHVDDDRATAAEMVRVTKPGGAIVAFAPNRLYPFETHGAYFGGRYVFGNIPLRQLAARPAARPLRAARARLHACAASDDSSSASRCGSCTIGSSTRASTTSVPVTPQLGRVLRRALYVAERDAAPRLRPLALPRPAQDGPVAPVAPLPAQRSSGASEVAGSTTQASMTSGGDQLPARSRHCTWMLRGPGSAEPPVDWRRPSGNVDALAGRVGAARDQLPVLGRPRRRGRCAPGPGRCRRACPRRRDGARPTPSTTSRPSRSPRMVSGSREAEPAGGVRIDLRPQAVTQRPPELLAAALLAERPDADAREAAGQRVSRPWRRSCRGRRTRPAATWPGRWRTGGSGTPSRRTPAPGRSDGRSGSPARPPPRTRARRRRRCPGRSAWQRRAGRDSVDQAAPYQGRASMSLSPGPARAPHRAWS